jgi:hypothetical protein
MNLLLPDLQSRGPFVLENVETNPTQIVDIGMIDPGAEDDFGGTHRVVLSQVQLQFESAAFVRRFRGPLNLHEKVTEVIRVRLNFYPNH